MLSLIEIFVTFLETEAQTPEGKALLARLFAALPRVLATPVPQSAPSEPTSLPNPQAGMKR